METIRGKLSLDLDWNGFCNHIENYQRVLLDLGTGDGRYVRYLADRNPNCFVIGVDSCRENLRESSRIKSSNILFIAASAQNLPSELNGLISQVTINFPWGSLLESLLAGDEALMTGLTLSAKPGAQIAIHLNGGAFAEAHTDLDAGAKMIRDHLNRWGWNLRSSCWMDLNELRTFPTTWAKRLAYGRDPRAVALRGMLAL